MGLVVKLVFVVFAVNFILACGPIHNSNGAINNDSLGTVSSDIFSKTVQPIIENNCALCHDGSTSAVAFAVSDSNISQNTLLNFDLVNLANPTASKIVTKIAAGHNGITTDVSTDLSLAIEDWMLQLSESE